MLRVFSFSQCSMLILSQLSAFMFRQCSVFMFSLCSVFMFSQCSVFLSQCSVFLFCVGVPFLLLVRVQLCLVCLPYLFPIYPVLGPCIGVLTCLSLFVLLGSVALGMHSAKGGHTSQTRCPPNQKIIGKS